MTSVLVALIALVIAAQPFEAQGKGKGQDRGKDERGRGHETRGHRAEEARGNQGRGRGGEQGNPRAEANQERRETRADQRIERRVERQFAGDVDLSNRGRGKARGRFARHVFVDDLRPSIRHFFSPDRAPARAVVGAVARAHMRGVHDDELVIRTVDDRLRIVNRSGVVLVDLDEERVRNLGRWDVIPLDDDVPEGAPSFCRSGEGHPVFGRQWCIDKRFGLGSDDDFRWGRSERLTDLVFRRSTTSESLSRDALLTILGAVAFDRLALHAITLGLTDPLTGRWLVPDEPGAARVLLVSSGARPLAEVVDVDRDDRADVLVVALRDW